MDAPAATCRHRFVGHRLDARGIASHQYDFGSSPGEPERRGSSDAASCPREHDHSHWD